MPQRVPNKILWLTSIWIFAGLIFASLCTWFFFKDGQDFSLCFENSSSVKHTLYRNTSPFDADSKGSEHQLSLNEELVEPDLSYTVKGVYQHYRWELAAHHSPLIINFFNHEEVQMYDSTGNHLSRFSSWHFAKGSPNQKRFIAYLIKPCKYAQRFYVTTFLSKNIPNPTIQVMTPASFEATLQRVYFDNRFFILIVWLCVGIGVFQLAYVINLLWSRLGAEYLWYFLFLLIGVYDFFDSRRYDLGISHLPFFLPTYIYNIHAIITYCYFRFVRLYISTSSRKPELDAQLRIAEWFLLVCFGANLLLYTLTQRLDITVVFRDVTLVLGAIINIWLLLGFYRLGSRLVVYLLIGASIIIVSSAVQHLNQLMVEAGYWQQTIFTDNLTALGGILDFVCLNIGLNYKHRLENIARQNAVVHERNRIAQEFHDKIKGLLGLINSLSIKVQENNLDKNIAQVFAQIAKISNKMLDQTKEIIWMLDSRNDNLEKLVLFLHESAREYLQHLVACSIKIPPFSLALDKVEVPANHRRQIVLAFGEALQNLLKHAQTEHVQIDVELQGNWLYMEVRDFGKGFDDAVQPQNGNGLQNLKERMSSIGGQAEIRSKIAEGTSVILKYPIGKK